MEYNSTLVDKAADMLVARWKTNRFPIAKEMEAPFMKLIRVPDLKKYPIPEPMQKVTIQILRCNMRVVTDLIII